MSVGLPWLVTYLFPFFLLPLVIFFLKPNWTKAQYIFYSFSPFVLLDLYQRLTNVYEAKYWILVKGEMTWELTLLYAAFTLFFLLLGYLVKTIFRLEFKNVSAIFRYSFGKRARIVINGSLLLYTLVLTPLFVASGKDDSFKLIFGTDNSEQSLDLFLTFVYLFVGSLIYFNYKSKEYLDQELERSKDQQLSSLSSYASHVESLYKELRSFRHDYTNILTSFNEAFQRDDLAMAKGIYQDVVAQSDRQFYDSKYDIANLTNLNNSAMKSICSAKLMEANAKGLDLTVEVAEPILAPNMDLLDVVTILSIFLDNAIEAAEKAEHPSLSFAYFEENQQKILIIENTTQEAKINTKTIFDYGKSSKGDERGIGLANVRDILAKYPTVHLTTSSHQHVFRQELRC